MRKNHGQREPVELCVRSQYVCATYGGSRALNAVSIHRTTDSWSGENLKPNKMTERAAKF